VVECIDHAVRAGLLPLRIKGVPSPWQFSPVFHGRIDQSNVPVSGFLVIVVQALASTANACQARMKLWVASDKPVLRFVSEAQCTTITTDKRRPLDSATRFLSRLCLARGARGFVAELRD